jgi:hypothetical protein
MAWCTLVRGWAMRNPKATKEELTAPIGKFRVLGVDVHVDTGAVYLIGDFDTITLAKEAAKQRASTGSPMFIYNDQAKLIVRYGSWH